MCMLMCDICGRMCVHLCGSNRCILEHLSSMIWQQHSCVFVVAMFLFKVRSSSSRLNSGKADTFGHTCLALGCKTCTPSCLYFVRRLFHFVVCVIHHLLSFLSCSFQMGDKQPVVDNNLNDIHPHCNFLDFCIFAYVMATVARDIEVSERQRARALAGAMLKPARVIQKQRFRQARPSHCFSCLRDSIEFCARQTRSEALLKDLVVVRRDVVRAGLSGSRRESNNFNILQRL